MQNNTNRIFIKNVNVRCSLTADLQLSKLVRSVPKSDSHAHNRPLLFIISIYTVIKII